MATANDENIFDSLIEIVVATPGRKLSVHTEPSKKRMKTGHHAGIGKIPSIGCTHRHDIKSSVICHADILTHEDISFNFEQFYENLIK